MFLSTFDQPNVMEKGSGRSSPEPVPHEQLVRRGSKTNTCACRRILGNGKEVLLPSWIRIASCRSRGRSSCNCPFISDALGEFSNNRGNTSYENSPTTGAVILKRKHNRPARADVQSYLAAVAAQEKSPAVGQGIQWPSKESRVC